MQYYTVGHMRNKLQPSNRQHIDFFSRVSRKMNTNTGDTTKNNCLAAIVCLMHSTVNQVYAIVMATHSAIEPLTPGRRNLNFEYLTSRPISDSMMQSFLLLTSTILISCALWALWPLWALGSALFFLFLASKMCYPLSLSSSSVSQKEERGVI